MANGEAKKPRTAAEQLARLREEVRTHGPMRRESWAEQYPISGRLRRNHEWVTPVVDEIVRKRVLTLGHQRMPWPPFLRLLVRHEVSCVVDLRPQPYGGPAHHFASGNLESGLAAIGIGYCRWHALTGRYERLPDYKEALIWLLERIAREARVLLLCVEEDARDCHRWTIVGRDLGELGVEIFNLRPWSVG